MKKINLWVLVILVCSIEVNAGHDQGVFVGGSIAYVSADDLVSSEANRDEIDLMSFELTLGYKYSPWLGLDIRYHLGGGDRSLARARTDDTDPSGRFNYSLDSYSSIYLRPELSNKESKVYLLLGYTSLDATEESFVDEAQVGKSTFSESGFSYGIGAGWFVDDRININLEYRVLLDESNQEFSLTSLGFDYRFDFLQFK